MNYYLHRISHEYELSHELFKNKILTIGFNLKNENRSQEYIDCVKDKNEHKFRKLTEQDEFSLYGRWSLWYFLGIKPGDIIVIPLAYGQFSVSKAKSRPRPISMLDQKCLPSKVGKWSNLYVNESGIFASEDSKNPWDLGFYIELEDVPSEHNRKDYSSSLQSRMKSRQTTLIIDDLADDISDVLKNKSRKNYAVDLFEKSKKEFLDFIRNNLNPDDFEILVCNYMERLGADSYVVPKNHTKVDSDASWSDSDVQAKFESLNLIINIQVKFHKGSTDSWAVEQIRPYTEDELSKISSDISEENYRYFAWVVTSADEYSEDAKKYAVDNKIRLIDGPSFSEMLLNEGYFDLISKIIKR